MKFKLWEAEQYRSASYDELEERRAEIVEELRNAESEFKTDDLKSEVDMCMDAIERCKLAAEADEQIRAKAATAKVIDSTNPAASGIDVNNRANIKLVGNDDPHDTPEYRDAFMNLVTRGIETRNDAFTLTTDAPVAIPTTLSNKIIEKLDTYGEIYGKVSKSSVQGGVEYAIDDFDFKAKWVGEEEVTDTQKAERKTKITFNYHEFESRVGISFLAGLVTLPEFEARFAPKLSKAITKLLEEGIIKGTGSGQMLGIVNDPRVTNIVEMTDAQFDAWQEWHSSVDAAILPEYDDGEFLFPKTTWNKHIDTMADSNKSPIAQFHYDPVSGKRVNTIIGKHAQLLGSDLLPDFDKAANGDVVAVYGDLSNYNINWQPGGAINILRYPDYDKRKNKMLAYGVCDGKVLDPYGFMLIKKKASI